LSNVRDAPAEQPPGDIAAGQQLGQTIKKGASWMVVTRFGGRVVRVMVFLGLAKILGPTALGAVGVIYVIDQVGALFTQLGFSAALIQRKDVGPRHLNSVMFINICAGVTFAAAIAASSPLIAWFFDNELLAGALFAYAAVFVVRSVVYAPDAFFRRQMRFRAFVMIGESCNVISSVVMIVAALAGAGVWSVVYAELLRAILFAALLLCFAGHRFRPRLDLQAVREMMSFSGWSLVNSVFYYGLGNIDYIVVGRVLGTTALGWYVFAFRLISQPVEQIAMRLHEVMFPAFSRFQHKPEEVLRVYRKLVCTISLFALPFLGIAAVLAEEFFDGVMGPEWRPAILPFQIMCLGGMMRAFVGSSSAVIKSKGHIRFEGITMAALFGLLWISVLIGCTWGLPGVAVAVNVVMTAYLATYLIYQGRKTGAGLLVFVDTTMPAVLAAAVAMLAGVSINWALLAATATGDLARLLIAGAGASLAFLLVILLHRNMILRSVLWELKGLFLRVRP